MQYKNRELESMQINEKQKNDELEKQIYDYNEIKDQIHASENKLLEERSIAKQSIQRLNEENDQLSNKLKEKESEDQGQMMVVNKILGDLLSESSKSCDFLSNINFTVLSIPQKLSNLEKLVKYLFCEKEYSDKKYNKLMELHNEAVQLNNKASNKFSTNAYQKLIDENCELKKQISIVKNEVM